MREEISAGGVVLFGNAILLLRKFNGDWVLPKGKVEEGENNQEAALREVSEETGVKAEILKYLGEIHYTFKENWDENRAVHKTVFWYLMQSKNMDTIPQKEEGFVDAKFIHMDRVVDLAKYDDEKEIIKVALKEIGKAVTITELQNSNEDMAQYSNQKLSALLKQMVESNEVVKTTDKKKSYFSISE